MENCEPWTNNEASQDKSCLKCVQLFSDQPGQLQPTSFWNYLWSSGPPNICPQESVTNIVSQYQVTDSLKTIGIESEMISASSLALEDGQYRDGCEALNRSVRSKSSLYIFNFCFSLTLLKRPVV